MTRLDFEECKVRPFGVQKPAQPHIARLTVIPLVRLVA